MVKGWIFLRLKLKLKLPKRDRMIQFYSTQDVPFNFWEHLLIAEVYFGQLKVHFCTEIVVNTVDLFEKLYTDL